MKSSPRKLFGIPNCDTVKKVRRYLEANDLPYEFVDFKKQPPLEADILRWKKAMKAWPVNTKGPTYRKIREQFERAHEDALKIRILLENTSALKRPILEQHGVVKAFGWEPDYYV